MIVWYDALTGKHVRYGTAIARRLRREGHEVVLTTRKHPDTVPLANSLHEKFEVVGEYRPKSLLTRLESGVKRQLQFCKMFEKHSFDAAISHGSPDMCRVAFGLAKPIITTVDTPYAEAVHRLTLPLSRTIFASKAFPARFFSGYNPKAQMIRFDGVDEVAWIKGFTPETSHDFRRPMILIRQVEQKAAYAKNQIDLLPLAKKLSRLANVVFLSRYTRSSVKQLIVPKGFVDSASLAAQADLFIGVGGTITREAALQGTPAIVIKAFKEQHVNDYLARMGFPIYESSLLEAFKLSKNLLCKKKDVKVLLERLENPVDRIASEVKRLESS